MPFHDRAHAAQRLAERFADDRGQRPLVLGIPRGAVPMAQIITEARDGELDVVVAHKLGAPGQPVLAIGALVSVVEADDQADWALALMER